MRIKAAGEDKREATPFQTMMSFFNLNAKKSFDSARPADETAAGRLAPKPMTTLLASGEMSPLSTTCHSRSKTGGSGSRSRSPLTRHPTDLV